MGLTDETLRDLAFFEGMLRRGVPMTPELMAEMADVLRRAHEEGQPSPGALRQRRYRQRLKEEEASQASQASQASHGDAGRNEVTESDALPSQSDAGRNEVTAVTPPSPPSPFPAPSLPRTPSLPLPLTPSPPPPVAAAAASLRARAREGPAAAEPPLEPRVALTRAANRGVMAAIGEQPRMLRHDHPAAYRLAEWLERKGIPTELAESAVFGAARSYAEREGRSPGSLSYFQGPIEEAWAQREALEAARQGTDPPPVAVPTGAVPPTLSLSEYVARLDGEMRELGITTPTKTDDGDGSDDDESHAAQDAGRGDAALGDGLAELAAG